MTDQTPSVTNQTPSVTDQTPSLHDAVAFLVELAALALMAAWGFQAGGTTATKLLLALGLPAAAMTIWGLFAAPRARYRIRVVAFVVTVAVLGGGAAAGFGVLPLGWAVGFAVVVAASTTLRFVGPFARRGVPYPSP